MIIPKKVFYVTGSARHPDKLVSFELALRDAGIHRFNLVPVSSIKPPGCEEINKERGLAGLKTGQIVFCVLCRAESCHEGTVVTSTIGVATPSNPELHGYFSEHHDTGLTNEEAKNNGERIASEMLRSLYGKQCDISAKSFVASIKVERDGEWHCAISAAIFDC